MVSTTAADTTVSTDAPEVDRTQPQTGTFSSTSSLSFEKQSTAIIEQVVTEEYEFISAQESSAIFGIGEGRSQGSTIMLSPKTVANVNIGVCFNEGITAKYQFHLTSSDPDADYNATYFGLRLSNTGSAPNHESPRVWILMKDNKIGMRTGKWPSCTMVKSPVDFSQGVLVYVEDDTKNNIVSMFYDKDGVKRGDLHLASVDEYVRICKKYGKICVLELKSNFTDEEIARLCKLIDNLGYLDGVTFAGQAIDASIIVAFYMYINKFFNPIQSLAEQFNWLQSAMASAEKIFTVLDMVPEIQDSPDAVEPEEIRGEIEFRDVWFAYVPGEWVLKGVSFKVEAGQTVAFVGATGSGKTTILSLICRHYDIQQGQILIDGRDIKEIKMLRTALDEQEQKARIANLERQANKEEASREAVEVILDGGLEDYVG